MNTANSHPAFDPEESKILSSLVPEGADANEPLTGLPTEPQTASADATATATPAAPEAAPAPAAPAVEATAPATAATTETATTEAPAAAAPATPPGGDIRAALRASRHAEKRLRDENARLASENEALKQGKGPVDTAITDEELAVLETDFPLQAKIVKQQRELERQIAEAKPAQAPQTDFVPASYDPDVQSLIDDNPDLVAWQYDPNAQDKFARAIAYDRALQADPDWRGKTLAERFVEAAARTKVAFGAAPAAVPTPTPQAAPAATRTDPAAVIAAAPSTGPKGISDFRGGVNGQAPTVDYRGMSDEQIMASLPQG